MATQNIFSMVDTWNAGATTFTAIKMSVTDTASAAGSLLLDLQVGGSSKFKVDKSGIGTFANYVGAQNFFGNLNTSGYYLGVSNDVALTRDAADTLAQRRSTNAQTFRLYEAFTDVSNYSRLSFTHSGGNFQIKQEHAGTGTVRELQMGVSNGVQWKIINGGHFLAGADNTYDIGAAAATRPRDVYVASGLQANTVTASTYLAINNGNTSIRKDASSDALLFQCVANFMEQRNSTNAQTFRVYNTFTDASNYERGDLTWSGNSLILTAEAAGTGTVRDIVVRGGTNGALRLGANATNNWVVNTSGHFLAQTDNTYDIGASAANRPRNLFLGGSATLAGSVLTSSDVRVGAAQYFYWNTRSQFSSPADGQILMINAAGTDFSRLQFGGTTSSFPALKRSSATLQARLADDSADAPLTAGAITAMAGTAIPAGGTQGAGLKVSSTADFGVFFGSGAPTLSAAKGSLYLRSDGTTTNDRAYINTDGSTTWTALTTAA